MYVITVVIATTLLLVMFWDFFNNGSACVQCGGWNQHRKDCPLR